MILASADTIVDLTLSAVSFTVNPIDILFGLVTGLVGAYVTAEYLYRRNADTAYNDALEHVIQEMKQNMKRKGGFNGHLEGIIGRIRDGHYTWLPKVAAPRFNARSRFLYAYFDVKAFDSFLLQGYATRVPEGRFESLSLFFNHCGHFNNESQTAEVELEKKFDHTYPDDIDGLDEAIEEFKRTVAAIVEKDFEGMDKNYKNFNPDNKEGLIEPYWQYPRWSRSLFQKTEHIRRAWSRRCQGKNIIRKY